MITLWKDDPSPQTSIIRNGMSLNHRSLLPDLAAGWKILYREIVNTTIDPKGLQETLVTLVRRYYPVCLGMVRWYDQFKGVMVLSKRWIVEWTFVWLGKFQRLGEDDEYLSVNRILRSKEKADGKEYSGYPPCNGYCR